jgi:hypothetical protein
MVRISLFKGCIQLFYSGNKMKSLLGKLIGKGTNAPASIDLKWLDELEKVDELAAIESSMRKLKSYFAEESVNEAERLRALLAIDQENRYRLNKITRQFVELENMRPELENKISETMYFYHRQIFIGYRSLTKRFLETADDIIFTYNRLPLVLGRALQAAYSMAKWRYYLQQPVAGMTWSEIFEIYKILEEESLLDLTVPLYRGELDSHLAASFVQACMLDSLGQSGLNKLQVERASLLLKKWIPWTKITKHYDQQRHLYYIDLLKGHGSKRIRLFEPTPNCRYWDTDQLSTKVDSAIEALDKDLPHDLDEIGNSGALLEILTILRSEWSRSAYKRQRRSEERQKVIKSVIVTYGFHDICEYLKKITLDRSPSSLERDESLDERLRRHTVIRTAPKVLYEDLTKERWMISDESSSGYGVIVSTELPAAIKLGKLVGMVVEDQRHKFIIGTLRSIKKLANGQHHIGIKIISKQASWMLMSHADLKLEKQGDYSGNTHQDSSRLLEFSCMYLPEEPELSNWPSLLLPRMEFTENGLYQANRNYKKSIIQIETSIEGKDDWVRVSYPE